MGLKHLAALGVVTVFSLSANTTLAGPLGSKVDKGKGSAKAEKNKYKGAEAQVEVMPSFASPTTAPDPKHKPIIEAPSKVAAGDWFPVTITVGKTAHPSLVEHHVRHITLMKGDTELVRTYLHPVHSAPRVTFWIALNESTTLRAVEEPTHAGAFYSEKPITVVDLKGLKDSAKKKLQGTKKSTSGKGGGIKLKR
jgi:superoxide reductase